MSKECNCRGYNNLSNGHTPEVVLKNPFGTKEVCIDECIAPVIKHLWKNNIATGGCCCGHGGVNPNVLLENTNVTGQEIVRIRKLIAEVDSRKFDIFTYELCLHKTSGFREFFYTYWGKHRTKIEHTLKLKN